MKRTHPTIVIVTWLALLMVDAAPCSAAPTIVNSSGVGNGQTVDFRVDDAEAQRIARRLLAKQIAELVDLPDSQRVSTAWVEVSDTQSRTLLVMHGCSATGNCNLYGFERTNGRWRRVLDSIAQSCSVLNSTHGGRRDILARMHGSATEATLKTYWWRGGRYVRVSQRYVVFEP